MLTLVPGVPEPQGHRSEGPLVVSKRLSECAQDANCGQAQNLLQEWAILVGSRGPEKASWLGEAACLL